MRDSFRVYSSAVTQDYAFVGDAGLKPPGSSIRATYYNSSGTRAVPQGGRADSKRFFPL